MSDTPTSCPNCVNVTPSIRITPGLNRLNGERLPKKGPSVTGPVRKPQNRSVTGSQAVLICTSVASYARSNCHKARFTAPVISIGTTNGIVVDGVYEPNE